MRNLANIDENKDIVTKDYVDSHTASIDSEYDSTTHTVTITVGSLEDADDTE